MIKKMNSIFKNINFDNFEEVINGLDLGEKMVENVKQLFFSEEVVKVIESILTQFTNLFYPDIEIPTNKDYFEPKAGHTIVGLYGTGKSHIMMFIGFLLGYGIDDHKIKSKYPNLKEDCWKIMENAIGVEKTKNFSHFRENDDFIVLFKDLTWGPQDELYRIIIKHLNDKFREFKVSKNELYNPDSEEELDPEKMAICWGNIVSNLNKKGIILLLDELYRYYKDLPETEQKPFQHRTGSAIQNFSKLFQSHINLGIVYITQKDLKNIDNNLRQVDARVHNNVLSFGDIGEIISNRFFKSIPPNIISEIYMNYFKDSANPSKSSINESEFKKNFPFHPKTILSLKLFLRDYESQSRGFAKYIKYCHKDKNLFQTEHRNVDLLITSDTLFDYIIYEITSDKEQELCDSYNAVYEEFIIKQDIKHQDVLSRLLKVIIGFSNPNRPWKKDELFSHFCEYMVDYVEEQWNSLYEHIRGHQNFISEWDGNTICYNPAKTGDVSKYVDRLVDILDIDMLLRELFSFRFTYEPIEKLGLIGEKPEDLRYTPYKVYNEYRGKIKYFFLKDYSQFQNSLQVAIKDHILDSMNPPDIEELDIENFIQGIVIFCRNDFSDNVSVEEIEEIVDNTINNIDENEFPNKFLSDHRDFIKNSIMLIKPSILEENSLELLKNSFSQWMIRKIIEKSQNQSVESIIEQIEENKNINTFSAIKDLKEIEFKRIIKEIAADDIKIREFYLSSISEEKVLKPKFIKIIDKQFVKGETLGINNWGEWKSIDFNEYHQIQNDLYLKTLYPVKYPHYYKTNEQGLSTCLIAHYIAHKQNYSSLFNTCFKNLIPNINDQFKCPTINNITLGFSKQTLKSINIVNEVTSNMVEFNDRVKTESFVLKNFFKLLDNQDNLTVDMVIGEYCLPPYGYPPLFTLLLIFILYKLDKIKITFEGEPWNVEEFNRANLKMQNFAASYNINDIIISLPKMIERDKIDNLLSFFNIIFSSIQDENEKEIFLTPNLTSIYNERIKNIKMTQDNQEKILKFISELPFTEISNKINNEVLEGFKFYNEIINDGELSEESNQKLKEFTQMAIFKFDKSDFFEEIQNIIIHMNEMDGQSYEKLSHFFDEFKNLFIEDGDWDAFLNKFKEYWKKIIKIKHNFIMEDVI